MESIFAKLIQDFENGKMSRRQLLQNLTLTATAATAVGAPAIAANSSLIEAVAVNHISYQVADYAKSRDFYAEMFGMKVSIDNGKSCHLSCGDSILSPHTRSS